MNKNNQNSKNAITYSTYKDGMKEDIKGFIKEV